MEYREYTPSEVNKDLKKNRTRIILAVFPLLIGVFFLIGAISYIPNIKLPHSEPISSCSYDQIESNTLYSFDELVVVSEIPISFGYEYLVSFTDKNGQRVYAQLDLYTDGMDLTEKCKAVDDPNFKIGDVVLSGVFLTSSRFSDTDMQMIDEAYDKVALEAPGVKVYTELGYKSEKQLNQDLSNDISFTLMFLICALGFGWWGYSRVKYFLRLRMHLNDYLKAYREEQ